MAWFDSYARGQPPPQGPPQGVAGIAGGLAGGAAQPQPQGGVAGWANAIGQGGGGGPNPLDPRSYGPSAPTNSPFDPRSQQNQQAYNQNANLQQMAQSRGGGWQGALQAGLDQQKTQMGPKTMAYSPQNRRVGVSSIGSASLTQGAGGRVSRPTGMLGTNLQFARPAGSIKSAMNDMNAPDKGGVVAGFQGANPVEVERQRMAQRGQAMQDFSGKKSYALAGYMQGK